MASVTIPGPDRDIVLNDIPDGLNEDQVNQLVENHLQQNIPGYQPGSGVIPPLDPNRGSRIIGGGLARGAAQGVGGPGDITALTGVGPSWLPTSPQAVRGLESVIPPLPQSMTPEEQSLERVSESVGSTWPYALPLGFASRAGGLAERSLAALQAMAKGTEQGVAAGTGGELGREYLGPYGELAGNIVGPIAGRPLLSGLGRFYGAAAGTVDPTVQAYRDLGIRPRLAGDIAPGGLAQGLQATLARAPGGEAIREAAAATRGDFGDALERTAGRLGTSADVEAAGNVLQQGARGWLTNWRNNLQTAWNAVNNRVMGAPQMAVPGAVPAGPPVMMQGVQAEVGRTLANMPNAPETAALLNDNVFQRLQGTLARDVGPSGSLPWQDARELRTRIGEKVEDALLAQDGTAQTWRRIYGQLTGALGNTAQTMGAGNEWAQANQLTAGGHNYVENVLSKIISNRTPDADKIDARRAALNLLNAGGTTLEQLRTQMPQAADELAAYKLRDMGTPLPSVQTMRGETSPESYLSDYNRLQRDPGAMRALFGADPAVNAAVDNLATVSASMRNTNLLSRGGAAVMHAAGAIGAVGGAAEGAREGYEKGGVLGGIGGGLGGVLLGYLAGHLAPYYAGRVTGGALTNPLLVRALTQPSAIRYTTPTGLATLMAASLPQAVSSAPGQLMLGEKPVSPLRLGP